MAKSIDPFEDDIQSDSDSEIRAVNEGSNEIRWEHSSKQTDKDSKKDTDN